MDNILDGYDYITVNGSYRIPTISIAGEPSKFEFWYAISDFTENKNINNPYIEFSFDAPDGTVWWESCMVHFLITGNKNYGFVKFETSIKVASVSVLLGGSFTASSMQLYVDEVSVNTATTTSVGTVRPLPKSGLKIAESTNVEIGEVAGDLTVKCGDGIQINEEGELTTTSDLSGSNWQSLDRYTNGFIVNGSYYFERQSNGNLIYKNANRTITISSNNTTMPVYVPPTVEGGGTDAI